MKNKVNKVVILGGGTAGWMSAALLVKTFGNKLDITLIESDQIGTIGVGEATIPPIMHFNEELGINPKAFIKATKATIKLGIEFENWGTVGNRYMHAFGDIGKSFPLCDFNHFFTKAHYAGLNYDFWDFSLNYQVAKRNAFALLDKIPGLNLNGLAHAYHFDAGLYAKFLAQYCQAKGVKRIEGKVSQVEQCEKTGNILSLTLENSTQVAGDLFIDCSGMKGLLIEQRLNTGFEDWSHWLPADSAIAVPSESVSPIKPFTQSIAHEAGWQWRIPLQHRTGNGFVYSSKYLTDEQAQQCLLANLDGKALAEPKVIKFKTGRRLKQWHKNVVAIGLSSGFLEPLESTSIHMIQSAIVRLVKLFPHQGIDEVMIEEFNRQSTLEYERIRDFIILHYKLNQRDDSQFWRDCQRAEVPQSLKHKMALFKSSGLVFRENDELFTKIAWQQVFLGQGLIPDDYHRSADQLNTDELNEMLYSIKQIMTKTAEKVPPHHQFIDACIR
ncbi:tryptophan halogenase family protein [Thalassotalea sp. PP2-459]|uniref:tryptophan halogenase family protein n=1 Tax=Thalassotalea sp. PP2-459 TaxID=1742724 RepID=UPI00094546C4|nr:tryptophan halogenase family protein [Thalassotalea sp. PP2-459]OKY26030.1 tryptophan halogenase [Thalassotalea sp. PP2-459]